MGKKQKRKRARGIKRKGGFDDIALPTAKRAIKKPYPWRNEEEQEEDEEEEDDDALPTTKPSSAYPWRRQEGEEEDDDNDEEEDDAESCKADVDQLPAQIGVEAAAPEHNGMDESAASPPSRDSSQAAAPEHNGMDESAASPPSRDSSQAFDTEAGKNSPASGSSAWSVQNLCRSGQTSVAVAETPVRIDEADAFSIYLQVEAFIVENGIDDAAATDLRSCPADVQQRVLEQGNLRPAELFMRMKKGRLGGASATTKLEWNNTKRSKWDVKWNPNPAETISDLAQNVEAFLIKSGLTEDSVADDLRGCPPEVQQLVMERGSLASTKNPAAALVIRIKNARIQCGNVKGGSVPAAKGGSLPAATGSNFHAPPLSILPAGSGGSLPAAKASSLPAAKPLSILPAVRGGSLPAAKATSLPAATGGSFHAPPISSLPAVRGGSLPAAKASSLPTAKGGSFQSSFPAAKASSLPAAKGGGFQTSFPAAKASSSPAATGGSLHAAQGGSVRTPNCGAATANGTLASALQGASGSGLQNLLRNMAKFTPSSLNALMSKGSHMAKDSCNGSRQGGATSVEDFITENGIGDNPAADDLRGCPPDVQAVVLAKGNLKGTFSPAASLVIRIKKAREQCGHAYKGRPPAVVGTDKYRPPAVVGTDKDHPPAVDGTDIVENFLIENGIIGDPAADELRECPPEVQHLVVEKGKLLSARNPAASLVIRIKNARIQVGTAHRGVSSGVY